MAWSLLYSGDEFGQPPCNLNGTRIRENKQMKDSIVTCIQCDTEFVFTASEQQRYRQMHFDPPRRCPQCRKHKAKTDDGTEHYRSRDKKKHYRLKYGQMSEDR